MSSNKDRLYIALYVRGGAPVMTGAEDTYHWALMVGPKSEVEHGKGKRYHAKQVLSHEGQLEWKFEELSIFLQPTSQLLVRVMIGKVERRDKLEKILRKVPVKESDQEWNCVIWVKDALAALQADGKALGTSSTDWQYVRDTSMWYVDSKKAAHRFDGHGNFDMTKVPTWDLLDGKETVE